MNNTLPDINPMVNPMTGKTTEQSSIVLTQRVIKKNRVLGWLAAVYHPVFNTFRIGYSKVKYSAGDVYNPTLGKRIAIQRAIEVDRNVKIPNSFQEEYDLFFKRAKNYYKQVAS